MPHAHTGSVDITSSVPTVYGTCLQGVFPAAVGEPNVEPRVPEDVDPSFGSILCMW